MKQIHDMRQVGGGEILVYPECRVSEVSVEGLREEGGEAVKCMGRPWAYSKKTAPRDRF